MTIAWTSTHSTQEFAAVRSVGFDPVGMVMGTTVQQLGYKGWGGCNFAPYRGSRYGYGASGGVAGTGRSGTSYYAPFGPLVKALYSARHRVVDRLIEECRALGGDGVVGTHLTMRPFPGVSDAVELQAVGTAVRSRGALRAHRPFTCDLSGQDFAKLLLSGWVPCGLVFGVAVGVKHDGYATQRARRMWSNTQLDSYTELVHETRAQVRRELEKEVLSHGGQGVVVRDMRLRIREQECGGGGQGRDHVAEATLVGTAIARFRPRSVEAAHPLVMLRLNDGHTESLRPRSAHQERV